MPISEAFSHLCRLVLAESRKEGGSCRCSSKTLPGGLDTYPLAGKVSECLEPEMGSATEALWLLPVPEVVSFCSPHSHLCRIVSVESGSQDGVSCSCSGNSLPAWVDTSPLAGKVPGCLDPEKGAV